MWEFLSLIYEELSDCFPKQFIILQAYQQCMGGGVLISPLPCQHLQLSAFLIIATLVGV